MGSNKTTRDLPCLAHLSVKLHITLLLNLTGFQQNAMFVNLLVYSYIVH